MLELGWIKTDEDFETLRDDKRFEGIIVQLENKITELENNLPEKHNEKIIIELPKPRFESDISLEETLHKRRSIRNYSDDPLTMEEVSQILWAAYGLTKPYPGGPAFLRGGLKTAPSAGARYPLEIYLVAGNVTELSAGIYKYKAEDHSIVKISDGDVRKKLAKAALEQSWIQEAPASLVYSAVYSRTTDIYGDRGRERYVCMDLGHSAENVYLQAVALDMGTVAIGAFSDIKVKLLINMTREEEPIYIMSLGKLE
ncbi:MAG: SagB family peptide dehydrogenase [Candidatus Cloacimonetes bacterium]|nr:SagB family peptide dehydrogenase [Candidatus Cloacimonadota bacterium]